MNLEQLEAVSAVVDKGSFRAAADHLGRSQPALSATIKNLEEEFDLLIFDRTAYRPKLTEAGLLFLNAARAALHAANYAARVAKELGKNQAETKLHVSVDALISAEVIEVLAYECTRPIVPVTLVIEPTILKSSYEPLLEGQVDLAIAPCPQDDERIEKIPLETVMLVAAVSRRLLLEKHEATAEFLKANTQILTYSQQFEDEPVDILPLALSSSNQRRIFVPDHATKLRLIEAGIGWGRIAETELRANPELTLISKFIEPPVTLELCLMRAKHRPIGPTARLIWQAFETRARDSKGG